MKTLVKSFLTLFCLCLAQVLNAQSFTTTPIWADEFNGTGAPDPAKWGYETGYKRNDELQYYTTSTNNVRQNNGNLEITVRSQVTQGTKNGTPTTFNYTSGSIITAYKNDWLYGKIVGRFKIPQGRGLWSCFWTLGANFEQRYWPKCGEIDIFEHIDSEGLVHTTVHYDDPTQADPHVASGGSSFAFDVTQFHEYSIEWTPANIKWFIDGIQVKVFNILNAANSTEEYHRSHYILINQPIGGSWPQHPDASTPLPATLYCDWVRVYGYVPANSLTGNQFINGGGADAGNFRPDKWFSNGWTASDYTKTIDVAGVVNPAPQAVYQSARQGDLTYNISGLPSNSIHKVRLHFAEVQDKIWSYFVVGVGQRVFNVKVNNVPVLTNFDIFAVTGGLYKAYIKEVTATSDASGVITVDLASVSGQGKAQINGIEVITTQVTGVSVNQSSVSIPVGSTATLTATVAPTTALNQNVNWSSSNPSIASVSSAGIVRGISAGLATVTATTQDGAKTATSSVTVTGSTLAVNNGSSNAQMGNSNFVLYPNPAKDNITLDLERFGKTEQLAIRITDVNGRVVYANMVTGGERLSIRFEKRLEVGIYFVSVQSKAESITQKFLVEK